MERKPTLGIRRGAWFGLAMLAATGLSSRAPLAADMGQLITVPCPNCGKDNGLSEKFCLDCGQDLRTVPSTAMTSAPNYIKPEPVKDGLPRYVVAVAIFILMVVVLVGAWYLTHR